MAWGEQTTVTASKVASSSASWTGSGGETWNVAVTGGATNQNVTNSYAQVGTKASPSTSITFSTSGISGTITSIVVDCASYSGLGTVSATVNSDAFGTQSQNIPSWSNSTGGEVTFTGSASGEIVITMTNGSGGRAMYIKSIVVTYTTGGSATEKVATPTFSTPAGTYTAAQNVTINCATDGASIYYTTNGTDPTNESDPYNGAINVASTTTIKAIAYVGEDASNIAVATYTILTPTTIADARSAENNETVCTTGTVTSVSGATAYIQDATSAIVLHNGNTNKLTVGDKVTVYGTKTVFNGLVEITNAQSDVVSQNNEVSPAVKTISEINTDYSGSNALQAMLVKIEDATVTAINGDNTTIAQGENTINIYKLSTEVSVNDKITSLVANIGCHNGVQLVNAKDVDVEQATEPAIVVEPATVELEQYEAEGTVEVTYQNVETDLAELQMCDAEGNDATYDWITAELNNDKNIEYLVEANTGAARTAYMKVYSLDAEGNDVYSDLISINQAAYAVDYAVLPFEWEGGASSDFNALAGVTTSGLGTDYGENNAPYQIKFDSTNDYILVKTDSRPGKVTVGVKMIGGANASSIKVQGSSDGQTFSDVETLSISGSQNDVITLETSNDFAENDRFVKLVFTKGSNVGIGAITIAKYTTSASITVAETEVLLTAAESEGTIGVTYKNLADTPELVFFAADGTTEAEYSWLVAEINGNNISYMVEANEGEARTAYMKVYGLDAEANDIYSELITITQAAAATPGTGDSYELFSGKLVEGDYIIYYEGKAMNTTVTNDRLQYEAVSPIDNVITTENAAIVWHIAKSGDYWTIYNADADAYAASTGAKNKAQMLEDGTDDKALWTVSGTETYDFVNKKNTANSVNAYLRNNGTYGFACYAEGTGGALSLYKKVSETPQPETVKVNISDAGLATFSSAEALDFTDVENIYAYTATINGDKISFTRVYQAPAETGLLLRNPNGGKAEADVPVIENVTLNVENAFVAVLDDIPSLATTTDGGTNYILNNGSKGIGFYKANSQKVGAGKAYLHVPAGVGVREFIGFDEETDGIRQIENGQTIDNAEIYNLSGQRVNKAQKGIYIVNGKKVVMK